MLFVVCLLAVSATASAQERRSIFDVSPYVVMVGGNAFDIKTTKDCFDTGRCHEGNGLTSTNQIVPLALSKASATLAVGLAMRLLERHGHTRIAKIIGYVDGSVTFAAAAHNYRLTKRLQ
jgi:hypothetical protein